MQVSLFRALKSANIEDDVAAKAVEVVEEHIDMAVGRAVQPLEHKITGLDLKIGTMESKLDSGLKGVQTSIDGLKWYIIILGSLMTTAATVAGFQFFK